MTCARIFDIFREIGIVMKYETVTNTISTKNKSSEANLITSALKNLDIELKTSIPTKKEVSEQIKSYIASWLDSYKTWRGWFRKCLLLANQTTNGRFLW